MKYLILVVVLILMCPVTASAHFLQTDGSIGGLVHINPNDDPIAGVPAVIFIDLSDSLHQINSENCTCQIEILKDNQILLTADYNKTLSFTFPTIGIYQLVLSSNQPKFSLKYDIRVDKTVPEKAVDVFFPVLILVAGFFSFIGYRISQQNRKL